MLIWTIWVLSVAGVTSAQSVSPIGDMVTARANELLAALAHGGQASTAAADQLADATALAMTRRESSALVQAEATSRLVVIASQLDPTQATRFAKLAIEYPTLMQEFAFQFVSAVDDPDAAVQILFDLIDQAGVEQVLEFESLAVALAVVHDQLVQRRVNENTVRPDDHGELFNYYSTNARAMQIDPRKMPAELLVFLVSATEAVDQLEWARTRYGRSRDHGQRFFEIQYDIEHFRTGQPKAVTLAPRYCIAAIKEHGGVCADQAYFAEHVAKANGVPAAYMRGRSGEVSHAWLGYLRVARAGMSWDFNAGRYEAYQGVRGAAIDPQTLRAITDGEMAMRASDARLSDAKRWEAEALASASHRIARYDAEAANRLVGSTFDGRTAERHGNAQDRVALLHMSVERRPGDPDAWRAFARLAGEREIEHRTIDAWLRAFERSSGRTSPDMLADIVELLLNAVPETDDRIAVLEWVFPKFRGRSDLQAWTRLKQGEVFESAGDLDNAWRAYDDVTKRFLNDGPFVVEAIDRMLKLLDDNKKQGPDLELLAHAFASAERPFATGDFRRQSNWYQIGTRFVNRLQNVGKAQEAATIQSQLGG